MKRYPKELLTPWFVAALRPPARDGRYHLRIFPGWSTVFADYRNGAWWIPGGPFDKPHRIAVRRRWKQAVWRGLLAPQEVA